MSRLAEHTPYHPACALRKPISCPSHKPLPVRQSFQLPMRSNGFVGPNAGGCNVCKSAQLHDSAAAGQLACDLPTQLHAFFAGSPLWVLQLQCVLVKAAVFDS